MTTTLSKASRHAANQFDETQRRCRVLVGAAGEVERHLERRLADQRAITHAFERQATEHARDVAEGVLLAYVAATRARDLLVVPGVGDEPYDGGWVSPLNAAL